MQLWNNDNKADERKNVHLKTKLEKKMRSNKLIFFFFFWICLTHCTLF